MFYFPQGSVSTIFRWGKHFSCMCERFLRVVIASSLQYHQMPLSIRRPQQFLSWSVVDMRQLNEKVILHWMSLITVTDDRVTMASVHHWHNPLQARNHTYKRAESDECAWLMCRRHRVRDAEGVEFEAPQATRIETLKTLMGWELEKGFSPLQPTRGSGERRKLLHRVRGAFASIPYQRIVYGWKCWLEICIYGNFGVHVPLPPQLRFLNSKIPYTRQYKQNLRNSNLGYSERRDLTMILFPFIVNLSTPWFCVFTVISSEYSPRYLCTCFIGHGVRSNPSYSPGYRCASASSSLGENSR